MTKIELKQQLLDELYAPYKKCALCPLGSLGRIQPVFGRGNPDASLLIVGEGPGKDEDIQGLPFVGKSGQLLTKMLAEIGFEPNDYYITNIVKCRPPANRTPTNDEAKTCTNALLAEQIAIINPRLISTLGSCATSLLLETSEKISTLRGKMQFYKNFPALPLFHPAYLLRTPSKLNLFKLDLTIAKNFIISNEK